MLWSGKAGPEAETREGGSELFREAPGCPSAAPTRTPRRHVRAPPRGRRPDRPGPRPSATRDPAPERLPASHSIAIGTLHSIPAVPPVRLSSRHGVRRGSRPTVARALPWRKPNGQLPIESFGATIKPLPRARPETRRRLSETTEFRPPKER